MVFSSNKWRLNISNMKKVFTLLIFLLSLFCCLSCKQADDFYDFSMYATVLSKNNGQTIVKAYPVNKFGQILNGVSVIVKNKNNSIVILEFDNENQCYSSIIEPIDSDILNIYAKNIYTNDTCLLSIPFEKITKEPTIKNICDESGNNAFQGDKLDSEKKLYVNWDSLGEDVSYQIIVKKNNTIIFQKTINDSFLEIPPLESKGTYYIYIKAQKSFGDIYYESEKYYSCSESNSSSIMFYVQ